MLAVLHADDPASKEGPWSVFYEADGNVHRIGPFDNRHAAEAAATSAQAQGRASAHFWITLAIWADLRQG